MANVRKRISELTALESASLDTTIVGVDGGTTYKIELDTLADAVTSRVNILDRDRLSSLESVTSSFETKGRSVISSSAQITTLGFISSSTTIPTGTISSSAQITSFGFVSSSIDISSLNSFTSSQSSLNTAFANGINARLQTSSFDTFSQSVDSRLIAATNEQSLTHLVTTSSFNSYTASQSTSSLVDRLNAIESVSGSWITESETGSFLTNLNGAISSSSQVIGILSSLNSVSASLISKTGSYATTGSNTFYGNQTFEGNSFVDLNIGDVYGGGVVFYVSPTLTLIADQNDLTASNGSSLFYSFEFASNSTGSEIGDGLLNTNQSYLNNPAQANTPIQLAYSSTRYGYSDWYLPSNEELQTLAELNPDTLSGIDGNNRYWSSTVWNNNNHYQINANFNTIISPAEFGMGFDVAFARAIRQINTNERPADNNNTNISITGSLSVSGSITGSTNFNTIVNKPTLISGSQQISDLGFVTGSYTTINSFNSLTQSFNSISQSFTTISGSVGTIDFSGINAVTASYLAFTQSFNTYTASISTASLVTSISNLNTFTASQSTSSLVNRLNAIENVSGSWITESETGSLQTSITNLNTFTASVSTASLVTSISNLNSATSSYLTSLSGAISSSSQLTSSFDTRYAISASFVSSSNLSSIQTITSASYAALTPVSGTLYIIIG